jgi:hypothetical protein
MRRIIKNSDGEVVKLNPAEQYHADYVQRQFNDLHGFRFKNDIGFERIITTLTEISKSIVSQKFFQIVPSRYFPIRVGFGAWASNILTYRSFDISDAFETGILNLGGQTSRLASVSTGIDSVTVPILNWAKSNEWSLFAIEEASRSGNWSLIEQLEISRKKNYDLGIQRIAFLGANGQNGANGNCLGLLNQAGITVNTTVIPQNISAMSAAQLKTFCSLVWEAYRANVQRSATANRFVIPESDFNGLAAQSSPDFPIKSILQILEETFKLISGNDNFKILPCAYADMQYSGFSYQIYALYNGEDSDSLRMDVPVAYNSTSASTINSFQFQNAAYSQFTGVVAYRPLELLYFTHT